jgi:hypothetical protein
MYLRFERRREKPMQVMRLSALAIGVAMVSGCGSPDPWMSEARGAAGVAAGGSEVIASHASYDAFECIAETPALAIVQQGRLGEATVGATTEVYLDPLAEAAAEDETIELGPCHNAEYEASAIFYEAASGAAGIDTVVYREFGEGATPDRLHTVSVRVR